MTIAGPIRPIQTYRIDKYYPFVALSLHAGWLGLVASPAIVTRLTAQAQQIPNYPVQTNAYFGPSFTQIARYQDNKQVKLKQLVPIIAVYFPKEEV